MNQTKLVCGITILLACSAGCASPYYTDRGAGWGAMGGALAGAAIGEKSGNALAGALIGGTAGAATGALVGSSIDRDMAESEAIIQDRMGRQMAGAATISDVVAMTQNQVPDEVIVTHIQTHGVTQRPLASDVINLHNQGVSDRVINAMQQAPPPGAVHVAPVAAPPVIVREHIYVPHGPPPLGWRSPRHRHARGGFSYRH